MAERFLLAYQMVSTPNLTVRNPKVHSVRIIVINLARSKDRRQLIESNLARLGLAFEFFTGVDAARGEHVALSRYNEIAAWRDLQRPFHVGEIGCFASHYLLWQQCVQAREPF